MRSRGAPPPADHPPASRAGGGLDNLDEAQVARLCFLAFLHDLGKCALGFRAKAVPELGRAVGHLSALRPLLSGPLAHDLASLLDLPRLHAWAGDFLYGTNRRFSDHPAADSIAVFRLDEQGVPERVQLVIENIAFPRAIQLDPTGSWLYALNQKGDSIVQFAIDRETGELTPTGNVAEVPTPVSLVFTTGG